MTGPLLVEDVALLLLHHELGPPVTTTTLLHAVGGAVLVDLAHQGRVAADGPVVVAVGERPPADPLLRSAHATVARRPRTVRSLVPELGADLWGPVVDRLVARGLVRRERRHPLGLHPVTVRPPADPRHEAALRAHLRRVQEGGRRPDVRTAAVLALLSAAGALPALRPAPPSAVLGGAVGDEDRAAAAVAAVLARAGPSPAGTLRDQERDERVRSVVP